MEKRSRNTLIIIIIIIIIIITIIIIIIIIIKTRPRDLPAENGHYSEAMRTADRPR